MSGLIGNRADRDLWRAPACGLGYLLLAVGTLLSSADHDTSTIWSANALLLATILPLRPRRWSLYFGTAFLGNLLGNIIVFGTMARPLSYGIADMGEVLIAGLLLQNRRGPDSVLDDVRSVLRFVLLGGMIAPGVGALLGATISYLMGQPFWPAYWTWYIADALGMMIFTPLFSGVVSGELMRWVREMSPAARLECVAILVFAVLTGLFTFLIADYPMLFVMTAVVMFATFRMGRFGTELSLIVTAVIGVTSTMHGHGPIAAAIHDRGQQALFLQFYLVIMLVSALPIAAELNARRALARRLTESEASLRLLASESADALIRFDEHSHCLQSSGAIATLLGVEISALVGNMICTFIDERDRRAFDEAFFQALGDPGTVAYREFRPRGRPSDWLECTLRALVDQDGRVYGAIGAIRDITLRKEREFSLSRAASTDSLTGTLNHAAFMARIDHALSHLGSSHLALVMIDIDHFKQVNDHHGHPAGDAVLVELTARLRAMLRDHDAIGRVGGDELAILLDGTATELALSIAEAMRATVSAKPILLRDGKTQMISISCGVAQAYSGISRSELLRKADDALYQAKSSGRDRVVANAL